MKLINNTLLFFIVMSLFGCSDELSRSTAEKLIKEHLKLPEEVLRNLSVKQPFFEGRYNQQKYYEQLKNEGLIESFDLKVGDGKYTKKDIYCTLSEKGKEYVHSEEFVAIRKYAFMREYYNTFVKVKVGDLEFGEIKGILETPEYNSARVDFTVVYRNINSFASILADGLKEGDTDEKTINMQKYDDGWRIVGE